MMVNIEGELLYNYKICETDFYFPKLFNLDNRINSPSNCEFLKATA